MKMESLKEIAELVGITAIIASLIFVGLQIKQSDQQLAQSEDTTQVELSLQIASHERDELAVIFEHADTWVRGNAGNELSNTEAAIYAGLVKARWSRVFWENASLTVLGGTLDVPLHDFAWFLHKNPGARRAWEAMVDDEAERRNTLIPDISWESVDHAAQVVREDLAKLDVLNP
jgi:hypothetical protein